MFFHTNISDILLFKNFKAHNGAQYFGMLVLIVAMCFVKEWLYAYRRVLASRKDSKQAAEMALLSDSSNTTSLNSQSRYVC
jgi:Ctr copper transporter family